MSEYLKGSRHGWQVGMRVIREVEMEMEMERKEVGFYLSLGWYN